MDEPQLFPKGPSPEEHLKKSGAQEKAYTSLSKNVTTLGSRLRVLEEQYSTIRNRSQMADSNLIDFTKDMNSELKSLTEDILELKRTLRELNESIDIVSNELNNAVKEHDFRVLEKYVDLWNPGQFVTKAQLKSHLEEVHKSLFK
ncbi:hypothetical protein ACFL1B_03975 [Nanoarchaeota archaeon]